MFTVNSGKPQTDPCMVIMYSSSMWVWTIGYPKFTETHTYYIYIWICLEVDSVIHSFKVPHYMTTAGHCPWQTRCQVLLQYPAFGRLSSRDVQGALMRFGMEGTHHETPQAVWANYLVLFHSLLHYGWTWIHNYGKHPHVKTMCFVSLCFEPWRRS